MKKIGYVQDTLRDRLLLEHSAYAAHYLHDGKFLLRCSAQIFNEARIVFPPAHVRIAQSDFLIDIGF